MIPAASLCPGPSLTFDVCRVGMAGQSCRIQWQTCEHSCRHRQGSWRGLQRPTWSPSSVRLTACRANCWSSSRAMTICRGRRHWLTCSWRSHEKRSECAYSIACWRYGHSKILKHTCTHSLCFGAWASSCSVPVTVSVVWETRTGNATRLQVDTNCDAC